MLLGCFTGGFFESFWGGLMVSRIWGGLRRKKKGGRKKKLIEKKDLRGQKASTNRTLNQKETWFPTNGCGSKIPGTQPKKEKLVSSEK